MATKLDFSRFGEPVEAPAPAALDFSAFGEPVESAGLSKSADAPGAISRGFVSGLLKQNPEMMAETFEGLSHLAPEDFRETFGEGAKQFRDLAKLSPKDYEPKSRGLFESRNLDEALTWAGEAFGQGGASTVPSIVTGLGGAFVGSRVGGRTGGRIGAVGGALVPSAALNYGEVYKALKDEKVDPKSAAEYAAYATGPMAALDVASIGPVIARLGGLPEAKRQLARSIARRVAAEGAKGSGREGVTEAMQAAIKEATVSLAADKPFWTVETAKKIAEEGIAGALVGTGFGAAGGVAPDRPGQIAVPQMEGAPPGAVPAETVIGADPAAAIPPTRQAAGDLATLPAPLDFSAFGELVETAPAAIPAAQPATDTQLAAQPAEQPAAEVVQPEPAAAGTPIPEPVPETPVAPAVLPAVEPGVGPAAESASPPAAPSPRIAPEPMQSGSWVIRAKDTGEVIMETQERKVVDALNTAKYEAVPILDYLADINRRVKAGEPLPTVRATAPQPAQEAAPPARQPDTTPDFRDHLPAIRALVRDRKKALTVRSVASLAGIEPKMAKRALDHLAAIGAIRQSKGGGYARKPRRGPRDVLQFIAESGGIRDEGGEMRAMDAHRKLVPGFGSLVRPTGKRIDDMGEALYEMGYFGQPRTRQNDETAGVERPTQNAVIGLIRRAMSGEKIHSEFDRAEIEARDAEAEDKAQRQAAKRAGEEIDAALRETGMTLGAEERSAAVQEIIEGRDPAEVLMDIAERSAIEWESDAAAEQNAAAGTREEAPPLGEPARVEARDEGARDQNRERADEARPDAEAAGEGGREVDAQEAARPQDRAVEAGPALRGASPETAYRTAAEVEQAVAAGALKTKPERSGFCYKFALQKAREIDAAYVIGTVEGERGRIYHAVAEAETGAIYDPQFDAWFSRKAYDDSVGGFVAVRTMTADEAHAFGMRAGKYPDPSTLGFDKPASAYPFRPTTDTTDQGPQPVIPGAERGSDAPAREAARTREQEIERLRGAQSKMRKDGQKRVEDQKGGLFGTDRDQGGLFSLRREGAAPRLSAVADRDNTRSKSSGGPEPAPSEGGEGIQARTPLEFNFDPAGVKGVIPDPERFEGTTRVDDPAVIAVLEGQSWRPNNWLRADGSLSPGGRRSIAGTLRRHNERLVDKARERAERRYLKDIARDYAPVLKRAHKHREMTFRSLPVEAYNRALKITLHKSASHNRRQSSDYQLMLVDGAPVYARKSNHWGRFYVNIKEGDPDAPPGVEGDQFGRVGARSYRWDLEGGQRRADGEYANVSQAGYIRLADLVASPVPLRAGTAMVTQRENAPGRAPRKPGEDEPKFQRAPARGRTTSETVVTERIRDIGEVRFHYSDAFEAEREEVAAEIRKRLAALNMGDVVARVSDRIEATIRGKDFDVDGRYLRGVIDVALNAPNRAKVVDHEAIHAMRAFGLFTDPEWKLLERAAEKMWRKRFDTDSRYDGLNEAQKNEEAIADAFADWRANRTSTGGLLLRIFNKIRKFLDAIRSALHGLGFTRTDQIFQRIEAGEVGARERGGRTTSGPKFAAAYHGSPHDFDRFTTEKIGTGEGAQAFGWGLYFAGKKEIAEYYRKGLSRNGGFKGLGFNINFRGRVLKEGDVDGWTESALLHIKDSGGDLAKARAEIDKVWLPEGAAKIRTALDEIEAAGGVSFPSAGRLYKVDLAPAEDEYLLWDKPLSEQSEKVQAALESAGEDLFDIPTGAPTGEQIYRAVTTQSGSQRDASMLMHDAGIRGVKYLDQGSRGQGEGSYNYVIFDEADVTIEEKFSLRPSTPDSAQNRQKAMQGMIAKGQPLDRAMRLPFDWFGGVDAKGEWQPGAKMYDKAKDAIVGARFSPDGRFAWMNGPLEAARAGLIDRYGLDPDYVKRERKIDLDKRAIAEKGAGLIKTLAEGNVGVEEARVLQAVLTGEAVPDAAMEKLSVPIRQAIDELGQEAVSLGLVSRESYERNRASYLHRVYMKHEGDQPPLARWFTSFMTNKRKKIAGDAFKGRGMFLDVDAPRLMRDLAEFREGRRGAPIKGEKFVILDKYADQGSFEMIEPGSPPIEQRVFWPANQAIPDRYKDFANNGTWEIRSVSGRTATLWRDFTNAERTKMGEITDARYTIGKTFMLMANDLATGRFYRDIATNPAWTRTATPNGKWVNATEFRRLWQDQSVEWVKVPDADIPNSGGKKRWGALAGKYVRAEIWRDLNEADILSKPTTWNLLLTQWKLNKTARSPVVHMNNVMSNFVFMDLADVRVQDLVHGLRAYVRETADFKEAEANGAFGSDIISQEIKRNVLQPILDDLQKQMAGGKNPVTAKFGILGRIADAVWTTTKNLDRKMVDAYRMEDEIFRMAMYMRRRSLGDSAENAALEARDQFLDYDIRAPWVNKARRSVLPFIAYTYRAVPVIARSIATRPWKLAKYFMIAYAANALAYMIAPGDEDEERRSMREEEKGYTWIGVPRMLRMPYRDAHGNPVFLDIRRWIPAGDVFDLGQGHGVFDIPAWLQFGGPLMLAMELMFNKSAFTGREIANPLTDTPADRVAKGADHLYKSWMPSAAWIPGSWYWRKIGLALDGATDTSGRPYPVPEATASSFGIKLKPQDVEENFRWRSYEFDKQRRALDAETRRLRRQYQRKIVSEGAFEEAMQDIIKKRQRIDDEAAKVLPR